MTCFILISIFISNYEKGGEDWIGHSVSRRMRAQGDGSKRPEVEFEGPGVWGGGG